MQIDPRTGLPYDPFGEDFYSNMTQFRNPNVQLGIRGQNFQPSTAQPARPVLRPQPSARPGAQAAPALSNIVGSGILGSMDAGIPINGALMTPSMAEADSLPEVTVTGSYQDLPPNAFPSPPKNDIDPALWDAMIQGGAGLLGGKNLKEGLSEGFSKFGTAYDASRKARLEEQLLKKPKIVPLADGAFSMIIDSDGNQKVVKNDEVAKYVENLTGLKLDAALQKALVSGLITQGTQFGKPRQEADLVTVQKYNPAEYQYNSDIASRTLSWLEKGGNEALGSPLLGLMRDETVGRVFGTDDKVVRDWLTSIMTADTMSRVKNLPGSLSEKELAFLEKNKPPKDAPTVEWVKWLRGSFIPTLQNSQQNALAAQQRLSGGPSSYTMPQQAPQAPAPAAAPAGGGGGGVSPNAQKYLNP